MTCSRELLQCDSKEIRSVNRSLCWNSNRSVITSAYTRCVFRLHTCVAKVEVFVRKLFPVDAHPARAVALHEVSTLEHKVLDHAMERCALVPRRNTL